MISKGNRSIKAGETAPAWEVVKMSQHSIQVRWGFTPTEDGWLYSYVNTPAQPSADALSDLGLPSDLAFRVANNWTRDKPVRVAITEQQKRFWLLYKMENSFNQLHPHISALLDYVRSLNLVLDRVGEMNYYYLDEIYPEDEAIIRHYGGVVEFMEAG